MYESYYQLSAKPFQLSPDPRFFYGSSGHKRAMSYLRYGLTQGEGFIIITGGVGAGKTTLVRALFKELSRENIVAAQLVTTQLEAEDTLRMVAASFGLAHEGSTKAAVLKNLETFFLARAREGKRVLLVVDEAQNLPVQSLEELRMLSNFNSGGRALLQSFLLGQDEFRATLKVHELEQLRQRIIASYHLEPLSEEETRAYVEHRLHMVKWQNNPSFSDEAFQEIFRMTRGTPRRINTFCDRLLLFGALEELTHIGYEQVREVADELGQELAGQDEFVGNVAQAESDVSAIDQTVATEAPTSPQTSGVESRLAILEERIDILERAVRSRLVNK